MISCRCEGRRERNAMRPKEPRGSGKSDVFKARLDRIVDLSHPLARLAATVAWRLLGERFGAGYTDKPGFVGFDRHRVSLWRSSPTRQTPSPRRSATPDLRLPQPTRKCRLLHGRRLRRVDRRHDRAAEGRVSRPTPSSCTRRASFWCGWPRGTA